GPLGVQHARPQSIPRFLPGGDGAGAHHRGLPDPGGAGDGPGLLDTPAGATGPLRPDFDRPGDARRHHQAGSPRHAVDQFDDTDRLLSRWRLSETFKVRKAMHELSLLLAIFLGFCGLSFVFLWLLTRSRKAAVPPLADLDHEPEPEPARPVLGRLTEALAAQLPMTSRGKAELEVALKTAGFYQPSALIDYAAVRSLLVIGAVLATGLVSLLVAPDRVRYVLVVGAIGSALGFSVPRFFLIVKGRQRCREVDRGLPFVIDLLAVSLAAG